MSKVVVVKDETGKLRGFGERGGRAFARFTKKVNELEIGEMLEFEWRQPRSPRFHRMFFGMLSNLFDCQEQFADSEQLRAWLIVGAGECEFVPGPNGRMVALPKSINWARMDDNEFRELVAAVWMFLRSEHAMKFLWPHLAPDVAEGMVETVLAGWDS